MFKNHPKGLPVLFFTEMWERFGFYTMLAILALYMDEHFMLPKHLSGNIYGAFIAFVYFTPLFGGWLADKWLGYGKSIVIGAILMGFGYAMLALDSFTVFVAALAVISFGNGFFKPNISTILGNLYGDNNPMKDDGYSIFYMGINIGAFFAPLVAAYLRNNFGWGYAFLAASAGMLVSLMVYLLFTRNVIAVVHAKSTAGEHVCKLTPMQEKNRIVSLVIIFSIVIFFWMAFHQNAYTLNFWARDCTATSIPPEVSQSINPFFVVFFTPLVVAFWKRMRKSRREFSTAGKITLGMLLTATSYMVMMAGGLAGGDAGKVSMIWLITGYAVITLGELSLSPMGLSLVNKASPPRIRGLMMGGWFAATAVGNYLSGFVGSFWEDMPHSRFFGILVITSLVAAGLMAIAMKKVNSALHVSPVEKEEEKIAGPAVVEEMD